MMRAMVYFGCARLPVRWNGAVFRTSTSFVEKLTVTLLTEPCKHGAVVYQSNKVQSLATYARGFHSVGFRAPAAVELRRRVDCSATGKPSKDMAPRKKAKPSSTAKVEDYFQKPKSKDGDQSPELRKRKPKPSATVEEEDERTEARVGKLGDDARDAGPSDTEARPPLSEGVHSGTLPLLATNGCNSSAISGCHRFVHTVQVRIS